MFGRSLQSHWRLSRRGRLAVRAAGALTAAFSVLLLPSAAYARVNDGEAPAHTTLLYTVGVYVMIPLCVFAIIGAAAFLPSLLRGPKYRTTRSWDYEAVWFSGPAGDPQRALDTVGAMQLKGGGASASW